jgi:hypothetical protein
MFSPGNPSSSGAGYYSTNYGSTWVKDSAAGIMYALSYSGKYVVKCISGTSNNIQFSSNYGTTYTPFNTGSSQPYPYFAAISNNGQIIATCSHTTSGVKISKNFGKTWTLKSTVGNSFFVAMSASGRYIMAGGNLSTDFGDTFTQPGGIPTGSITGLSVSATGQYMIITNFTTSFYSVDYGKTWLDRATNGSNATNGTSVVMTANASFVMQATSTGIYKYTSLSEINASSAYIANNLDMSGSINAYGIFNNGDVFDSAMDGLSTNMYSSGFFNAESQITVPNVAQCQRVMTSSDGKYITIVSTSSGFATSNNYGATFTNVTTTPAIGVQTWGAVMSDTGQYQHIVGNQNNFKTTDYGNTWVQDSTSSLYVAVSGSGKYVLKRTDGIFVLISSNFGATYTSVRIHATNIGVNTMGMSKSGQVMIMNCTANLNKISTNFGKTWRDLTFATTTRCQSPPRST